MPLTVPSTVFYEYLHIFLLSHFTVDVVFCLANKGDTMSLHLLHRVLVSGCLMLARAVGNIRCFMLSL